LKEVLAAAGRRFLQTAAAAFLVFLLGLLSAPNLVLDNLKVYGVAFLVAIGAAFLKFVAEVIPFVSVANYVPDKYRVYAAWADAFIQAAVAAFVVAAPGVFDAPDLKTAGAIAVAALIGALTAGIRALEGLFTKAEQPATVAPLKLRPVAV
jgi:hypothetical protein